MMNYLRLFRFDVALIAFFSYMIGARFSDSTGNIHDILIALAVTLISTNFIYTLNSWADRDIDMINKPYRPIPAGKLKAQEGFIYSVFLFILSCLYPFFIYNSIITLCLFLLLPVLGFIYSSKPFQLRRYSIPSVIIISTGLIIPLSLGYFVNKINADIVPLIIILFFYCLAIVPLKDIEDVPGDCQYKIQNLFAVFGINIIKFSLAGLFLNFILLFLFNLNNKLRFCMSIFILSSIILIIINSYKKNYHKIYQNLIFSVCIHMMLFYLLLVLY